VCTVIWKAPARGERMTGPVLFLDRDGVIIIDKDYLSDPDAVELVPGAGAAMARAAQAGWLLVGLSNQSGFGRGYFGQAELAAVMKRVDAELAREGVTLDGLYYCPHAPDQGCRCRKPGPGLLEEASASFAWDAGRSWVIGDKASDVELGRRYGLGAVLVGTGYGPQQAELVRAAWPDDPRVLFAVDLPGAVAMIVALEAGREGAP
jgi:histidinol-phosphate phosphatase family protein